MSPCSVCRYQIIDGTADICPNCGAPLKSEPKNAVYDNAVPVTRGQETPAPPPETVRAQDGDDALELCDPGEFLGSVPDTEAPRSTDRTPIGKTTSPLPPGLTSEQGQDSEAQKNEAGKRNLQKLSSEQIKAIRSNLMNGDDYVSPDRAGSIINNLSKSTSDSNSEPPSEKSSDSDHPENVAAQSNDAGAPAPEPRPVNAQSVHDIPQPGIVHSQSPAVRRVAYFHKNFIQLTGHSYPATGDELVIGELHYLLRPKKLKSKYVIGAFCVVLVLLLFAIGKQFLSPTLPGAGGIIGIVLDQDGRPYISGAQISLAETGKRVTSDAVGFFRFDKVPTGVYVVKFARPDGAAGTENVSVVNDLITTITLGKNWSQASTGSVAEPEPVRNTPPQQEVVQQYGNTEPAPAGPSAQKEEKPVSVKDNAVIKLQANVEDAKVAINGQVVGMGNLAYKNIKPGIVKVNVTKDGYKGWNSVINLKSGEIYSLAVTLDKIESTPNQQHAYTAEDFYQSGQTMLGQGNPQAAAGDFTEAINLDPQLADAYQGRARAYQLTGTLAAAEADYIKAGQILAGQKRFETANDAFSRALEVNKRSIPALMALADLSERRGDRNKAFDIYAEALKYDEGNFQANFELGKLLYAAGKNKDADKRLRKACEIDPRSPEVYHYLMLNYFARDDFGKVKKTYADFKLNVPPDQIDKFKTDPKFDPILRIVGEYERP